MTGPAREIRRSDEVPDAETALGTLCKPAQRPVCVVLGREYVPNTAVRPYKARGIASWYGKKFHGRNFHRRTPRHVRHGDRRPPPPLVLPLPRKSNARTKRKAVVVHTTAGPFHADPASSTSYTAAYKLGLVKAVWSGGGGSALPGESAPRPLPSPERDEIEGPRRLAREESPRPRPSPEAHYAGPPPACASQRRQCRDLKII